MSAGTHPKRMLAVATDANDEALHGPSFPDDAWDVRGTLALVADVRIAGASMTRACETTDATLARGETVVIESDRGLELATVANGPRREWLGERSWGHVLRRASTRDLALEARARVREDEARHTVVTLVRELGLAVKVVRVDLIAHGTRATVVLASEERVELRELAKRLQGLLRARIEVRLVGLRDAAQAIGAIGPCGLQLCCNTFLADFAPVSMKMARDQGLALKPERTAGVCGKLMCCLVYEEAFYREQRALFPKPGKRVTTPAGDGVVRDVDVLARTVRVALNAGGYESFAVDDVKRVTA